MYHFCWRNGVTETIRRRGRENRVREKQSKVREKQSEVSCCYFQCSYHYTSVVFIHLVVDSYNWLERLVLNRNDWLKLTETNWTSQLTQLVH